MNQLIGALSSRALTAYLLFAYAVFLVFLTIWGARIPSRVVVNISHLAPFWLMYLLAAMHMLACLWVFWGAVHKRCSLQIPAGEEGERIQVPDGFDWARAARKGGLKLRRQDDEHAVLVRNRWSPAGTLLFHAALFLIPVAFLVSRATRFQGEAWIVEGHSFRGTREEYTRVELPESFERRAPRLAFNVENVEAVFWGDRLFFTNLRALIAVRRGDLAEARWITLPQPAWLDGARVSIRGFNYTPAFELRDSGGALVDSADLNLRLFPAGTEDSFDLPGLPYRMWVRLYPNSDGPKAQPLSRGFDLTNPLFHAAVTCGKRLVAHAWLRVGDSIAFDGYRLAFTAIRRGGDIVVHRDRGYAILWVALILALAGTVARILFPSSRIWLWKDKHGWRGLAKDDPFAGRRGEKFFERVKP